MQDNGIANSNSTVQQTSQQYHNILAHCKELFLKKTVDYGTSWRVLRPISIVDQIYIKAWRIRQIQETGTQLISDSIESEFVGIVNYSLIALIQSAAQHNEDWDWSPVQATSAYDLACNTVTSLMLQKNHDYGEAWRAMSQQSIVDLILVKLLRLKQIIANDGRTIASEGMDANFQDIVNYGIFALILLDEAKMHQ
ncbi:MAG: DUF1599 domain-containing protein [Bacteroidetes bacterium]|nr:DUF1599 domain-containing protein [Bacteroidota bacterium]